MYKVTGSNGSLVNGFVTGASLLILDLSDTSQIRNVPWPTFQATPPASALPPLSYQIFPAPVKSVTAPLQLPVGSVVDLGASGHGNTVAGAQDFTVMFSPTGSVDCVYYLGNKVIINEAVFLLMGRRDKVGIPFIQDNSNQTTLTNYQNLNNLWVMVKPQSGAISTESMATSTGQTTSDASILASRSLANQAQGKGGR
jgi:hypothetical protein